MLIYYSIWGIVSLLAVIEVSLYRSRDLLNCKIRGLSIWIIWCIFIGFVCFKGSVGTDYYSYQYMFENISIQNKNEGLIEPLFLLWMEFIHVFTCSFPIFWMITGLLNISLKFYVIRYLSPFVSVSILIYLVGLFFERDFDGIRQGISIGIAFFACVLYLKNRKWHKYTILIICAVCFHYTAILFFLTPILGKVKLETKWILVLLGTGFLFLLININVLDLFFTVFGYNNFVYDKLYSYLVSDNYSKSVGINVGLIFRMIILLLFVRFKSLINMPEKQYNLLLNGFLLAIMVSLLFNNIEILSHRLAYGFREFQIFIIPHLILAFKGQRNRILFTMLISVYSLILLYRLLTTPHLINYYYYSTIFS